MIMEVFRLSAYKYAQALQSSGRANRWNLKGQLVIYASSSRSLATLEMLVHKGNKKTKKGFKMMVISIADEDHLFKQIYLRDLPDNWRHLSAYNTLQKLGSDWYKNRETLILKIPSAVIPIEHNLIINHEYPSFSKYVKIIRTESYFWDERLQ